MGVEFWHHTALDALGVVLYADGVSVIVAPYYITQTFCFDVFPSCGSILSLHYDHVSAIPSSFPEQAAGCGVLFDGGYDLVGQQGSRDRRKLLTSMRSPPSGTI